MPNPLSVHTDVYPMVGVFFTKAQEAQKKQQEIKINRYCWENLKQRYHSDDDISTRNTVVRYLNDAPDLKTAVKRVNLKAHLASPLEWRDPVFQALEKVLHESNPDPKHLAAYENAGGELQIERVDTAMRTKIPAIYDNHQNKENFIKSATKSIFGIGEGERRIKFHEFEGFLDQIAASDIAEEKLGPTLFESTFPCVEELDLCPQHISHAEYIYRALTFLCDNKKHASPVDGPSAHGRGGESSVRGREPAKHPKKNTPNQSAGKSQLSISQGLQESQKATPPPPPPPPPPADNLRTPFDLIDLGPFKIQDTKGSGEFCLTQNNGQRFHLSKKCFDPFSTNPQPGINFSTIVGQAARDGTDIFFSAVSGESQGLVPKIVCSLEKPSDEDSKKSDTLCRKFREYLERGFFITSGDNKNVRVQINPRQADRTVSELTPKEERQTLPVPVATLEALAQLPPQSTQHNKKPQNRTLPIADGRLAKGQHVNFPHRTSIERIGDSDDYKITFAKGEIALGQSVSNSQTQGRSRTVNTR